MSSTSRLPSRGPVPKKIPLLPKEISWLAFNERVLEEADDPRNPLLERIRFLGIVSNNQDEFYRVRVAALQRGLAEAKDRERRVGTKTLRVMKEIEKRVIEQSEEFHRIGQRLFEQLGEEGIHLVDEQHLNPSQAQAVREYFQSTVRPRLVPIICHKKRELPVLRDQFIYLAVQLTLPMTNQPLFALVEVPTDALSRFFILPRTGHDETVILLEDVIRFCLNDIFAQFRPLECRAWTVKVTRDSELSLEPDPVGDQPYVLRVERSLRKRRTGNPVRMVYDRGLPGPFLKFLLKKLDLVQHEHLIAGQRYHNFKDFMRFPRLGRDDLTFAAEPPLSPPALIGHVSVFDAIRRSDILLHCPYDGFGTFIDFLREAAIDPHVTDIRMTVYRVSPTSSVLNALTNAARNRKQVTVVIELLARFDEENNLEWVDRLRDEGVRVITGVRGLKVHAKLCVVTRTDRRVTSHFATIGTGNFNEDTARVYSDHFFMTANPSLTREVLQIFDFFANNFRVATPKRLVVSPFGARRTWVRLIRKETQRAQAGEPAKIWIKLNNFTDVKLIRELYRASEAGVEVRLIVRSMFSLVCGLPGISDNIEAVSLVGRYLEHSRLLIFGNGGEPLVYLTSGDWMARNFDERVEVACPIDSPTLRRELLDTFETQWADTANARVWDRDLTNRRRLPADGEPVLDSQRAIRTSLLGRLRDISG